MLHRFERERGEVLIPIEVNALPSYVLRLSGAALRSIDTELARSLERVGHMLGSFLEWAGAGSGGRAEGAGAE